jgi:hypothetical protein
LSGKKRRGVTHCTWWLTDGYLVYCKCIFSFHLECQNCGD